VGKFTTTLDKLDKIGKEGVIKELNNLGVDNSQCERLLELIIKTKLSSENLDNIGDLFNQNPIALEALQDLTDLIQFLGDSTFDIQVELDLSLARGLDYYTGCIFEVIVPDSGIGSVSGGGRYDNLTEIFGLKNVSGVGISFGVDRLFEVLESHNLWPTTQSTNPAILICHFDKESQLYGVKIANELRGKGHTVMVYPENKRINKQLDYANTKGLKYAIVIGQDELLNSSMTVKDLASGTQHTLSLEDSLTLFES